MSGPYRKCLPISVLDQTCVNQFTLLPTSNPQVISNKTQMWWPSLLSIPTSALQHAFLASLVVHSHVGQLSVPQLLQVPSCHWTFAKTWAKNSLALDHEAYSLWHSGFSFHISTQGESSRALRTMLSEPYNWGILTCLFVSLFSASLHEHVSSARRGPMFIFCSLCVSPTEPRAWHRGGSCEYWLHERK